MGNLFSQKTMIDRKYQVDKNKRIGDSSNWQQENADNYSQYQFERFDTYNGLFNTQQFLGSVDFSDFSKHCFFNSAVSKVEYSFNQIYDDFPVDGTAVELEEFYRKLDGFGRYIYNQIDKNIGYLKFNNSYIEVQNKSGYLTSFNRNEKIIEKISKTILNPGKAAFSFDFRIWINYDPIQTIVPQVIFQYLDKIDTNKNGFSLFIKDFVTETDTVTYANLVLHVSNATNKSKLLAKFKVPVNSWQHISICVNNNRNNETSNSKQLKIWLNSFEQFEIDAIQNFNINDGLEIDKSIKFYIGKGESHISTDDNGAYNLSNNSQSFSGYIDEFRFLHQAIDQDWIIKYKDVNIFAQDTLKLYFKFNEPTGIYEKNMFCFDSSGNSLHSRIQLKHIGSNPDPITEFRTIISSLRYNPQDVLQPRPSLKFEKDDDNPCLMPTFTSNITLNNNLLSEAKEYDLFNPNLIFKLFPRHYFNEGAVFEGLSEPFKYDSATAYYIFDSTSTDEDTLNYPGQQKGEGVQTFSKLLLIWARFFDEIKMYLDVMPKLINIDYTALNSVDSAVNFFLPLMAKNSGFEFKEIMNSPTSKLLDGYIIGSDGVDKSEFSLRFVQNELWKRILINSRDILQSKGTKNAIRSIFNAIGVVPEEYYRFREFGKSQSRFIENSLLRKIKNIKFFNFSNTNTNLKCDFDISYLNGLMNYNSSSYSFEFYIHYPFLIKNENMNEVLLSVKSQNSNLDIFKIVFEKNSQENTGKLKAILYQNNNNTETIQLDNVNLLNNNISHVVLSIDNSDTFQRNVSFSVQNCSNNADLTENNLIVFKNIINADQLRLTQQTNKIIKLGYENFNGQFSHLRIWKNVLSKNDLKMHALDITSFSNHEFQFLQYQKISDLLLLNLTLQDNKFYTNLAENIVYPIDYSENSALPTIDNESIYPFKILGVNNLKPLDKLTFRTTINYENDFKFDEPNVDNKVIPLSFQDENLINEFNVQATPVYEINYDKQKKNDIRFSIEMSNTKHLNEDIGKLFDSIVFFADIISDFGAMNEGHYNKFEKFSDFYFKRIKSNQIQMTPLYDLYQIFDNVLTEMLQDFISSRVKFNNNIYVIESHALERHKFHYKFLESHIVMKGDMNISNLNNSRKSFNYLKLEGRRLLQ
jgi:hypothetical protein